MLAAGLRVEYRETIWYFFFTLYEIRTNFNTKTGSSQLLRIVSKNNCFSGSELDSASLTQLKLDRFTCFYT